MPGRMPRYFIALIFLLTVLHSNSSHAANQARITNMNDISLGTWDLVSPMTGNDPVCVYRDNGPGTYTVKGTDSSTITPAQFRLENAAHTVEIPYTINWGNTSAPGANLLTDNVNFNGTGANTASQTCAGGTDANFKIDVTAANLANKPAGTYTATVTFNVSK
jgi:hypothetical protein